MVLALNEETFLGTKSSGFPVMEEAYRSSPSFSSSSSTAHPHMSIGAYSWLVAEQTAKGILSTIQPTWASEYMRKDVIDYLHSLIGEYFRTEVLPFGSVPLKTYLPDGDIDLTIVHPKTTDEDLARHLCNILEYEKQRDTEFVIKNVEYVPAQVRVVKCTVQDIAVDISFNQMAGLSALCFLEQADQLTGKDHLFKRSIILIKAWCYYESRILGALHGLIATYALDLLVLHIVNLFHSSLNGPLSVLYRFLNYYSTFDWDKYCVSLNGPVAIASLPEIVVETPKSDGSDLLLSPEFFKSGTGIFSVSTWALQTSEQAFPIKHLNIIDPLNYNNNLGRSIFRGNFHRIRYAFSYGARKLGEILRLPQDSIGEGLRKFFVNTLNRNGMGRRPDVRFPVPVFGAGNPELSELSGDCNSYYASLLYGQHYQRHKSPIQTSPPASGAGNPELADLSGDCNSYYASLLYGQHYQSHESPIQCSPPASGAGNPELCDLSGDCNSYYASLLYGQHYQSHKSPIQSSPPAWPSLIWNNGAGMQLNQNFVSPIYMNCFVPRPFCHQEAAQSSSAALGHEEIKMVQGIGTYIPVVSDEESQGMITYIPIMESRGTGTFIPDICVQEKMMSQGTGRYILGMDVEEKLKSRGMGTFITDQSVEEMYKLRGTLTNIPDVGFEENYQPGGTGTYNPNVGVEQNAKMGGTGTYNLDIGVEVIRESQEALAHSSDLGKSPCKQMHIWGRGKDAGQSTQGLMLNSSLKNEPVHVSSEMEKESGSCLDLSLEEFPLLPGIKKKAIPSETPQPGQPTVESPEGSPVLESIEFGSLGPSLSPDVPSSPRSSEQPDLGSSTSKSSEPPELSEHKGEMVLVQPYKLEDEKDFPPLR